MDNRLGASMTLARAVLVAGLFAGLCATTGLAAEPETGSASGSTAGTKTGSWTVGGGVGFLGNTPDDTAFAFNLHVDRFLNRNVSVGPLLQLGFTENMTQTGLSAQGKYWMDLPGLSNRLKLVMQAGIGFVHSDFRAGDTSWLIPIGVGLDYKMTDSFALTSTFLLNFTDLDTGGGTGSSVMPGLIFGVRF